MKPFKNFALRFSIFFLLAAFSANFAPAQTKASIVSNIDTKVINNPPSPLRAYDLNVILKSILNYNSDTLIRVNDSTIKLKRGSDSFTVVVPGRARDTSRFVNINGSYTNPSWLTAFEWNKLTSTPTTLSGYGIVDAYTVTQTDSSIAANAGGSSVDTSTIATHHYVDSAVYPPYKEYVALLNQTDVNAPVATVLKNTLGFVPVFDYGTVGRYHIINGGGLFIEGKTFIVTGTQPLVITAARRTGDDNTITIYTYSLDAVTYQDDQLINTPITIRIYP